MVCDSRQALESSVYNEFRDNFNDEEYLLGRAVMSSTNEDTQECNIDMVSKIPTIDPPMISLSRDECIEDEDKGKYDVEFLNRINESGLPPHRLVLKVGACIILIRNLSIKNKHCNGTRYIILHLSPNLIKAKRLGDNGPDSIVLIPRTIVKDTDGAFVSFKRVQFPVLLAYYLTLNRAQGQSLQRAGIYLPQSVFSHGHLYVGFSRCGDPDNVFVFADQREFENLKHKFPANSHGRTFTRNVVYKDFFSYDNAIN